MDTDENEDVVSGDFAASCRFRREVSNCTRYWLGLDAAAAAAAAAAEGEEALGGSWDGGGFSPG